MSSLKKTGASAQKKVPQHLLEQYLFGTLTEAQRHQVERQLLDDPLTAEATEGLSTQQSATHMAANLADLRSRLHNRIAEQEEKRQIRLPFGMQPYAIAASVAVLLVSAVAVLFSVNYLQKKDHPTETVALQKGKLPSDTQTPPAVASVDRTEDATKQPLSEEKTDGQTPIVRSQQFAAIPGEKNVDLQLKDSQSAYRVASTISVPATGAGSFKDSVKKSPDSTILDAALAGRTPGIEILPEKVAVADDAAMDKRTSTFKSKLNPAPESQMMATMEKSQVDGTSVQIVQGKVTDVEDGLGIPGVVVSVPGTSVTAVTDRNGMYKIAVPASQNELSFSFIGYQTYSSPVNQQAVLNARLMPDVKEMGEVVVITGQSPTGQTPGAYQPAQPTNPDYIKTIEQKLEASPNVFTHTNPGSIKLSFTIQPDGSLTDVKVLKSTCSDCDQAAVQALKESSQWKPARENGKPVSQTMRIRIPLKKKKK